MAGINKVIIIGNVGQVDIKQTGGGLLVANVSIATSDKWTDKQSGQTQERTEWHKVVFFSKLAELIQKYVQKGSKLYVEGSLKTEKYDKDGQTHYATKIMGKEIQFLSAAKSDQSQQGATEQQYRNRETAPVQSFQDDDVPW